MSDGMTSRDSVVFTSWKEIASYLGKGVRTVQRWEAQFGLPVQRPNARAKGIVRASREELDRWIATRWSSRSTNPELLAELDTLPSLPILKITKTTDGIDVMHRLRTENRQLLSELEKSLIALNVNCKVLTDRLEQSRRLSEELLLGRNGSSFQG